MGDNRITGRRRQQRALPREAPAIAETLRILIVEDSEDDALLVVSELEDCGLRVDWQRVQAEPQMRAALDNGSWDIVLSDYRMPGFDAPAALRLLKASGVDIPFIVISGTIGEDAAVSMMRAGAHDYLMKGHLIRLKEAVMREIEAARSRAERNRAERALAESEEKFRRVFHSVSDGILMADVKTRRLILANRAICIMLGYSEEEFLEMTARDIHPEKDLPVAMAAFEQQAEGTFPLASNIPVRRKDGTVFQADIDSTLITLDGHRYLLGCFRDMTEKNHYQASLIQSDRLASMGMLAAGVAHEINNPLFYVLYNLDTLAEMMPQFEECLRSLQNDLSNYLDADQLRGVFKKHRELFDPTTSRAISDHFGDALNGTEKIRDIVRGLSTFSRVEKNKQIPLDVEFAVECACSMAANEVKYRAQLVKEYRPTRKILGSEGRLSQVFLNLLINAAQAIDEGDLENNEIRIAIFENNDEVCVEVADTGKGIPRESLQHVFEPFYTTKAVGVGTGLGLAISRNIISEYGGHIEVTSEEGKGSCFLVRLPVANEESVSRVSAANPSLLPAVHGRILVVDDEQAVRSAMKRILEDHEVVDVPSGFEAREILERDQAFDLIVCDVMMPSMSGMELYSWLAETHPALTESVVFVTGGAFTPKARCFLDEIGNPRVEKPLDPNGFKRLISTLIINRRG
jgi:PAS domain S-box-containing protein